MSRRARTMDEALAAMDLRIDRSAGPDACWPWHGTLVKGRGQVGIGRKRYYVPRLVLMRAIGRDLLPDKFACHHCDNPRCCNPTHLYEGSAQSNVDDMWARHRNVSLLGRPRPDVSARHRREAIASGQILLEPGDWEWFMDEMRDAARLWVARFIERTERGDRNMVDDEVSVRVADPDVRAAVFWDSPDGTA